jgi:hypothetical protein
MQKSLLVIILLGATLVLGAQERETRTPGSFSGISFGVAGELHLVQGTDFSVVLEGDRDVLRNTETYVKGDRLIIRDNRRVSFRSEKITVWITLPEIDFIAVSGSGTIYAKEQVVCEELTLGVSGSGSLIMKNLAAREAHCSISGSGFVELNGPGALECGVSISGSGKFSAEEFKIGEMDISVSGSGNCKCYVVKSLEASISGSGNVYYSGDPSVNARISGSGKVRKN